MNEPTRRGPMRRRWEAGVRKRRLKVIRQLRRANGCGRHVDLLALHAEPNGNNPPKLIGHVCRTCTTIFTPAGNPSAPTLEVDRGFRGSMQRTSKAHAARLRAVDRLGIVDVATTKAAA